MDVSLHTLRSQNVGLLLVCLVMLGSLCSFAITRELALSGKLHFFNLFLIGNNVGFHLNQKHAVVESDNVFSSVGVLVN